MRECRVGLDCRDELGDCDIVLRGQREDLQASLGEHRQRLELGEGLRDAAAVAGVGVTLSVGAGLAERGLRLMRVGAAAALVREAGDRDADMCRSFLVRSGPAT